MSKIGDFNLQLTEALANSPTYSPMTPQEALQSTSDHQKVYDTIKQSKAYQRTSQSLTKKRTSWDTNVAVDAFLQWAENTLLKDGAWDNFFTENNTEWELECDGTHNLVFDGDFETLAESLFEDFEHTYGDTPDDTADIAIPALIKRLTEAWELNSTWENEPDHLGEAINQAFDDFVDNSNSNIEYLDERKRDYEQLMGRNSYGN